jgi:4-hydroxybenzoate decarboxylase subunit C
MGADRLTIRSTGEFVEILKRNNELWVFEDEIDPELELACVQREVCRQKGPAVLFTKVKGCEFPVVTNLYGSENRLELAFGEYPKRFVKEAAETLLNFLPPRFDKVWKVRHLAWNALKIGLKNRKKGPVYQNTIAPADLTRLPQIKSWDKDGGAFITLPLVYTESPESGKGNLGMYRIQLFNQTEAGIHIQIHRGGGYHYHEAEKRQSPLPVGIFVGGPPALTLAAIAPLPEDIPELLFASLLMGERLNIKKLKEPGTKILLDCDFALLGSIQPEKRKPEGPFGDHYGYYSLCHPYPYADIKSIHHRNHAIYPATIVGRPPQEDHYITEYLQETLEPLYPLVLPNVKKLWAYEESGVHSLAAAIVKNRYYKEAFTAALRILGEGQLSLSKFLLITDHDCNIRDFKDMFIHVLERADFRKDLYILSNISQDTLDYTGPKVNKGSKVILMGIGDKIKILEQEWQGELRDSNLSNPRLFCPGVLCVEGSSYKMNPDLAEVLVEEASIRNFSIVCLVDDPAAVCKSTSDFIWHVFTRFEPASDIYGNKKIERMHIAIEGPVVIDCRMKPWYPEVLVDKEAVLNTVQSKWGSSIDKACKGRN